MQNKESHSNWVFTNWFPSVDLFYTSHLVNFHQIWSPFPNYRHGQHFQKITFKIFKLLEMSKIQTIIMMLVTMMIQLLIKIYPVSNQKLFLLNPCHLGPVIQGFYLFHNYPFFKTTALLKSFNGKVVWSIYKAVGTYFNMMGTDYLEMYPLASSDPPPPTNLPPYVVYHTNFNATEKSHT